MWRPILAASFRPQITLNNSVLINRSASKLTLVSKPILPLCRYSTATPVGSAKPELPKFKKTDESDNSKESTKNNKWTNLIGIFTSGALSYVAISYYMENKKTKPRNFDINYQSNHLPGLVKPSKSITRSQNPGNVKLTLYQFTTCPFCCKVRAYLDYYGYSYDVVEVNSLTKKQLDWSTGYKGVPVLAVQIPSKENPGEYEKEIVVSFSSYFNFGTFDIN